MANRNAFTLIELLVVVTIIVVLLALLVPAMDTAMESVRRAVCGTRLHTFGVAHHQYALDNKRKLAPGWAATKQGGSQQNAVWVNGAAAVPGMGSYREVGHLAKIKYIHNADKALYCPDLPPQIHPGQASLDVAWPRDGDCEAKADRNAVAGDAAIDGVSQSTRTPWVHSHYNYRTTLEPQLNGTTFTGRPAKLSDPGNLTIHTDYFTQVNAQWSHMDGYNASHLDGSVNYVYDPTDYIRRAYPSYFGPGQELMNQESAYQRFFDKAWTHENP